MSSRNKKSVMSLIILLTASIAVFLGNKKVDVHFSKAHARQGVTLESRGILEELPRKDKGTQPNENTFTSEEVAGQTNQLAQPALSDEASDVICKFIQIKSSVPHEGFVQVFAARRTSLFNNQYSNIVWIKSDDCPDGLHSIVHFSNSGEIEREFDCRYSGLEEITAFSAEQSNIKNSPSSGSNWNLAISGNGYLTFQCPQNEIMLSRDGRLERTVDGYLENADGCVLLNESGLPWLAELNDEESNCNFKGECIGIQDPSLDEIHGLEYINSHSFLASSSTLPAESITKKGPSILRPKLFHNSIEDLWSPDRHQTGVSWINHPTINLKEVDCQNE